MCRGPLKMSLRFHAHWLCRQNTNNVLVTSHSALKVTHCTFNDTAKYCNSAKFRHVFRLKLFHRYSQYTLVLVDQPISRELVVKNANSSRKQSMHRLAISLAQHGVILADFAQARSNGNISSIICLISYCSHCHLTPLNDNQVRLKVLLVQVSRSQCLAFCK